MERETRTDIPLKTVDGTYVASKSTKDLLEEIGGRDRLLDITTRFYPKMFRDKHLQQFVVDHSDPHPERLADWIAEKMSGEGYWSPYLRKRPDDQPFDRQSAHNKAWHSFRRDKDKIGLRFKLDDSIVWMRLLFWSARECGFADTTFWDWFIKFISHFIRVYESTAPPYTVSAAIWSANPDNLAAYEAQGWLMTDVCPSR